jgi:hypothetical protein
VIWIQEECNPSLTRLNVTQSSATQAGSAVSVAYSSTTWSATYLTILQNTGKSGLDSSTSARPTIQYANFYANIFTSLAVLYGRGNGMTLQNCAFSGNSVELALANGKKQKFLLTDCSFNGSLPGNGVASLGLGNIGNTIPLSYSFQHFYTFHCETNSPTRTSSTTPRPTESHSPTPSPTESVAGFHASLDIAETAGLRGSVGITTASLAGSGLLTLRQLSGSSSLATVTGDAAMSSASLTLTNAVLIGLGTIALLAVGIVLVIVLARRRRAAADEDENVPVDMSTAYEDGFDPTFASCIGFGEFENPETMAAATDLWNITDPRTIFLE